MKTVQDYLDLGLVLDSGDRLSLDVEGGWIYGKSGSHLPPEYHGVVSFAWRNNDGVKPEYKGVIEVTLNSGQKRNAFVSELIWLRGFGNSVAKWRPVVLQSESLTVSPKEDKPMKPVYTAEMHQKGEIPQVGADCILIIDSEPRQARVTYIGESIGVCSNIDGGAEYAFFLDKASFKPITKTIKVNGFDVPAPMSEAPMIGDEYFTPQTGYAVFYCANKWICDGYDHRFLSRGLVHATESAAIAHAKAMLGIDPNA